MGSIVLCNNIKFDNNSIYNIHVKYCQPIQNDFTLECKLDVDYYMAARDLGSCLTKFGSIGNTTIDYIEVHEGNEEFLEEVCKEINEDFVFDMNKTLGQLDQCNGLNNTFYMYPSTCNKNNDWPGEACLKTTCIGKNVDGFYCKRKNKLSNKQFSVNQNILIKFR